MVQQASKNDALNARNTRRIGCSDLETDTYLLRTTQFAPDRVRNDARNSSQPHKER